jgi:transposase
MILELHRQGVSVSSIARRVGLDRKTVHKYIERGLEPPLYGPRPPRASKIAPFSRYLCERLAAFPQLTGRRLHRELRDLGYTGGYSILTDFLRDIRPIEPAPFEVRFETPPGRQAQVDFAHFRTVFTDEPGTERILWLFSLVLGHSRMLWAHFVLHQDLPTLLRCHAAAFEAFGGVPEHILYDRMRTVVSREEPEAGHIVYNRTLLEFARHYGYLPKACKPYRAKTKGKVERPYRYIREDFFLGRSFRNLDDLNQQLRQWLDQVANVRMHATTRRVVAEHFAEERPKLQRLPAGAFQAVLRLERRITLGRRQPLQRAEQCAPAHRRGAQHRQRGAHSRGRPRHCGSPRLGWTRPAAHPRRPPELAASGQQPHAPQWRTWRCAFW